MSGATRARPGAVVLAAVLLAVGLLATAAAAAGIGVRSTYGGNAAVDEPQYLLTALSLYEDGDLDISDELAEERWRAFHDTELPQQTSVLPDGRRLSPHDPLLPLVLAVPVGLGGWVGAKVALALLAGVTAALAVWVAVRRFAVPLWLAAAGTAIAAASPPLAVYGSQVYPELPAALAVLVGVAALTGPLRRGGATALASAVVALPWLGVKYVPVAAALAVVTLWRLHRAERRRTAVVLAGGLAAAGLVYLGVHRLVWGGWTVYAAGDHFEQSGEFGVVGFDPDYVGRSLRLVGLLVDRTFGIVPWQPAWLLGVVAVAALARRRPPGALALAAPLATGWATATWIALTMHGYWWPGRQLVVVLPVLLVVLLWWLARVATPAVRVLAAALGLLGVLSLGTLLRDGYAGRLTWVVDFHTVANPAYQWLRPLLPDYRGTGWWPSHLGWAAVLLGLLLLGWVSARRPGETTMSDSERSDTEPSDTEPSVPPSVSPISRSRSQRS